MVTWLTLAEAATAAGISTATIRRRLPGLAPDLVRRVPYAEALGAGLRVGRKGALLLRADAVTGLRSTTATPSTVTPATCNLSATSTRGVWPVVADLAGPAGVLRLAEHVGNPWRLLSVTRMVTRPDGKQGPQWNDRRAVVLEAGELPDLVRALREHGDAPRGAVTTERPSAAECIGLVRTCARQGVRRGVRVDVLDVDGRRVVSLGECRRFALRRKGHVACVVMPAWAAAAVADLLDGVRHA